MIDRITQSAAIAALKNAEDGLYAVLHQHGTLEVGYYQPRGIDEQQPHDRDEVYVVVSGSGYFVSGETRAPVEPGEVLFVAAGVEHRFEEFSDDFGAWVMFYGPKGGEVP